MNCPKCQSPDTRVLDSRAVRGGVAVRRRRVCENPRCRLRFTTLEQVALSAPSVLKRDGRLEDFDREKVRRGIRFACAKRDVPDERIDAIADAVAKHVGEAGGEPVPTEEIGRLVSTRLRALDEVAYLRYASLFRRWRDAAQFLAEIENLIRQ